MKVMSKTVLQIDSSPLGSHPGQENYLTAVFGFLGLTDISFIRAEGLALGPEAAETAMRVAEGQLCEILGSGG
jgi:FMN-dependent NADH-azoreductase